MAWRRTMLLAAAIAVSLPAGARSISPETVRFRAGDNAAWSSPAFDDTGWSEAPIEGLPSRDRTLWIRAKVNLSPRMIEESRPLGLYFAAMASHEIYWDGVIIGRGGVVGSSNSEEVPGPIEAQYIVPSELARPGEHTIAIRASAFNRHFTPSNAWWGLVIGDYDRMLGARSTYTWLAMSSLSGILVGGFFALLMFLTDRRDKPFLVLSLLCFIGAALLVAESWRALFGYSYDLHIVRLLVVTVLSWLLSLVLVLLIATRFPLRDRWKAVAATAALLLLPALLASGWDGKARGMFLIGLGVSSVWSIIAIRRGKPGSGATAIGIGAAVAAYLLAPFRFADLTLFFALDVLLICLLGSHAIHVRRDQKERDVALLRSARLESELLRKNIQPHFLMNTLTALSEWIEEDPLAANRMIEALAEEFRLLSNISNRALIPVRDELQLCRLHLELMSARRHYHYELTTREVDLDAPIPPAVFHTLVENAITHGGGAEDVVLRLHSERNGARVRYVFEAPLGHGERDDSSGDERTGLRYIRARLEESFGSMWELTHGPVGPIWRTEITIPVTEHQ